MGILRRLLQVSRLARGTPIALLSRDGEKDAKRPAGELPLYHWEFAFKVWYPAQIQGSVAFDSDGSCLKDCNQSQNGNGGHGRMN